MKTTLFALLFVLLVTQVTAQPVDKRLSDINTSLLCEKNAIEVGYIVGGITSPFFDVHKIYFEYPLPYSFDISTSYQRTDNMELLTKNKYDILLAYGIHQKDWSVKFAGGFSGEYNKIEDLTYISPTGSTSVIPAQTLTKDKHFPVGISFNWYKSKVRQNYSLHTSHLFGISTSGVNDIISLDKTRNVTVSYFGSLFSSGKKTKSMQEIMSGGKWGGNWFALFESQFFYKRLDFNIGGNIAFFPYSTNLGTLPIIAGLNYQVNTLFPLQRQYVTQRIQVELGVFAFPDKAFHVTLKGYYALSHYNEGGFKLQVSINMKSDKRTKKIWAFL